MQRRSPTDASRLLRLVLSVQLMQSLFWMIVRGGKTYGEMRLEFPQNNGGEAGFASPHVNRESVTEEVVVRELLQNALDASLGTGPMKVKFSHRRIPTQQLPLIKDYTATFNAARKHRLHKVDSPAERQAIDRIRGCLQSTSRATAVLACIDRGRGIDATALKHLYNTGDTTKRSGRGSVGLGHLTAFAASDLRYVLYAGRDTSGRETFGGHAILATSSSSGKQLDAHGYIRGAQELLGSPASQASGSSVVPDLVRSWLPNDGSAGSVVAVIGYGPTAQAVRGSLEDRVLAAAAKSFVVAVHQGQLTVDCLVDGVKKASLEKETLAAALSPVRDQQRRRLGLGVLGREAWAAFETLEAGERVAVGKGLDGVTVWMRHLEAGERTLVCVFREGMWITSHAPHLQHANFTNLMPFCAVVNVDDPSAGADEQSVCALVREAEGETHSQIRPSEITDSTKKELLDDALQRIAEALRGCGKPSAGQIHEPEELRIFRGRQLTPAPAPPIRRREKDYEDPPDDSKPPTEVVDIEPGSDDGGGGTSKGGKGGGGGQDSGTGPARRRISSRGNTSGIRVASRHVSGREWSVVWRANEIREAGLRLVAVLPSGTDETTERQLDDAVLRLASVKIRGRAISPTPGTEEREVRLSEPNTAGEALVELAEDVSTSDAALVTIRLMHAKRRAV